MADTIEQNAAIDTEIAEYSVTTAALAELRQRFGNVAFDLTTTKGDKDARAARYELVKLRTSLEAKRKELKAPALERSRLIDAEARRITAAIVELEEPIDEQIVAVERQREAERQAKVEAEQRRVASINDAIDLIRGMPARMVARPAADVEARIKMLVAMTLAEAQYQELLPAAHMAHAESLATLRELHAAALVQEAEAARIVAERADLDRRQREQAESERVERERIAAEQKAAQARIDEQRAELEQQQREARAGQERIDAQARAERAEADRKAAQDRAEADERGRAARQAEEDRIEAARAALRQEQDRRDEQARQERANQERIDREARAAEERRQAEVRAEQRRQEEAAAIADKRVRDAAPKMLAALQTLVTVTRAMDCEVDGEKPSEEQYQAALAQADEVIAIATGGAK